MIISKITACISLPSKANIRIGDGRIDMARSEKDYLLDLWLKNVCPFCGKNIPDGKRVGSGKKADGGFCSLGHFTAYHELTLKEKAKKVTSPKRKK